VELECGNSNEFIQSEVSNAFSVMFWSWVQMLAYSTRYWRGAGQCI